jgi:hypothetical protein
MQLAERRPPSVLPHRNAETEAAVWILIVVLVGLTSFAILSLFDRIGG